MKVTKSNLLVSTLGVSGVQATAASDEALDRLKLEERLSEVQRNARCVWRAVRLMVFLAAFAVVGLGLSTVLIPYWPQTASQFLMLWPIKAHCALGFASLGCAFVFSGLGLLYRRELSWLGLECRRLATEVTGSGDPRLIPLTSGSSETPAAIKEAA